MLAVTTVVEVSGLYAGHKGVPAVRDLDLTVDKGQVVALLGPNGAGKTTTLLTIAGVLPVFDSDVTVLGRARGGQPVRRVRRHSGRTGRGGTR